MFAKLRDNWRAVILAVGLHVLLAVFLIVGVSFVTGADSKGEHGQNIIMAEVVTPGATQSDKTPDDKQKAAAEAKRKAEAEAKRRAEAEAKRKAEAEAARKAKAERQSALEDLLQQSAAGELTAAEKRAQAAYVQAIRHKVQSNWTRPPGAGNIHCEVRVTQMPGGDVISAKLVNSCGSPAVDRSVLTAIRRSSPLPVPPPKFDSIFQKEINFIFDPSNQ